MPTVALQIQNAFAASPANYDESGGARSAIPFSQIQKIDGPTSNAIVTTIRPTSGTAAFLGINPGSGVNQVIVLTIGDTFAKAPSDAALTVSHKTLTGTSFASIQGTRALSIVLTADDVTTAEVESGTTASRVAIISATMNSDDGGTPQFTDAFLRVDTAGQRAFLDCHFPEPLVNPVTLEISIVSFALATKLQIFAAGYGGA